MSVAFTNLTSGVNNAGVSSVATASVTLTASRLHLLFVVSLQFNGSAGQVPTCTGWTQIASFAAFTAGGTHIPDLTLTVLRRMPGSDETGAHTIDFSSVTQTEIAWSIDQSDANADTTGTNGSGAIVQSATAGGASVATISATLAAFGSADNGTWGGAGSFGGGMTAWTVGSGFTALANYAGVFSTDLSNLSEYRTDNDTTVDASTAVSVNGIGMIALEIKAAAVGIQNALAWVRA